MSEGPLSKTALRPVLPPQPALPLAQHGRGPCSCALDLLGVLAPTVAPSRAALAKNHAVDLPSFDLFRDPCPIVATPSFRGGGLFPSNGGRFLDGSAPAPIPRLHDPMCRLLRPDAPILPHPARALSCLALDPAPPGPSSLHGPLERACLLLHDALSLPAPFRRPFCHGHNRLHP